MSNNAKWDENAEQSEDGQETPPSTIPGNLAPHLWRPVIRLTGNTRIGVIIGPGFLSSVEAVTWADDKIEFNKAKGARKLPATRRSWRNAHQQLVLSSEIPLLDHGPRIRQKIQKTIRRATLAEAIRLDEEHGPQREPNIFQLVKQVAPDEVGSIRTVIGPGRRGQTVITAENAEAAAAASLLGTGRQIRTLIASRRWPRLWHAKLVQETSRQRTLPASVSTTAALLDWRETKGFWPKKGDDVGEWHRKRRWARFRRRNEDETNPDPDEHPEDGGYDP